MILVDTAIWIDHIRAPDPGLSGLLASGRAVIHPFVIGEIALGSIRGRAAVISMLHRLRSVEIAFPSELLLFVERHDLHGFGIGYVDAHLLASARLTGGVKLWTRDRRLNAAATRLDVAWDA